MRILTLVRPIAVALSLFGPLAARAAAQDDARALAPTRVAGQVGSGLVLMPVGFVAGGKLTKAVALRLGVPGPRASRVALAGGYAGAALATAAGPALVGARGPGAGSYLAALGGAAAGGLGSALLVRLNDREGDDPRPPCRLACTLTATAVFLLPSVSATVGYNLSRSR
jgi:hypothetical protein